MASNSVLFPEDFPPELTSALKEKIHAPAANSGNGKSLEQVVERVEREHIAQTLKDSNFNKSRAAETLGIDRGTLYRKAGQYGIPLKDKNPDDTSRPTTNEANHR